ncbi:MAG: 2-oxoacid:acceptor oxidoreductase family protein [Candidatus Magasanikbacteria bacterium]
MILKILLSGDGGQGIQFMSDVICKAAFEKEWFVSHIPNYGLEQRGGISLAFIQIADKEIAYPRFTKPDIMAVLSHQAHERVKQFVNDECKMLNIDNYEEILKEQKVPVQSYNIFFLGLLANFLEEENICKKEDIFKLIEKKLSVKPGWEENKRVWEFSISNFKF